MKLEKNVYKFKIDRIMLYLIGKDKVILDLNRKKGVRKAVKEFFC